MIVMGGIIGAGIFTNPYVVAQQVHTPLLILGAWAVGGLIALAGAFIYAELSSQSSESGGQYVYLRDALHPLVAFAYGWSLLFVIQTGGMAARNGFAGGAAGFGRAGPFDDHKLYRRARRQRDPEYFHDSKADCDRSTGRIWIDD